MSRGRAWQCFRWLTRCATGISVVLLVLLTCVALWPDPQPSISRNHSIADDGPWAEAYRHALGTKHDHGSEYAKGTPISYSRRLFAYYSVFVHVMALVFPIRASCSVWHINKGLKRVKPVRRPKSAANRARASSKLLQEGSLSTSCALRSASESSASEYDAEPDIRSDLAVVHAILLPNYCEDIDNVRETLEVLACHPQAVQCYDVYLAMEEREAAATEKASILASEFATAFRSLITTIHPSDIPGEAPGKSSNIAWAAQEACRRYSKSLRYSSKEHVIITVMDSDSLVSANYFSLITDMHLKHGNTAQTTIYVPPIIFDRNANSVSPLVRVSDVSWCGAGLSGLYDSSSIRPPTSVYSIPLTFVERVGGWDAGPEAIGEDLHMYVKCFFALGGNLTTRTVLSAASQSNVYSHEKGFRGTIGTHRARWKQAVRHMWGSLDTGYSLRRLVEICWYGSTIDDDPRSPYTVDSPSIDAAGCGAPLSPLGMSHETSRSCARLSPNWTNIIILFHRLYEAHFLPLHLLTVILSSTIYTFFTPREQIPLELSSVFQITNYLRFAGVVCMFCYFGLYESFHHICVTRREKEMQRAGLAQRMQGSFVHRKFLPSAFDYCLCPIAGMIFASIPMAYAQLCHFWTVDLAYTVTKKPQRIRPPMKALDIV